MIEKDKAGLNAVLDDSFVLHHMTGMKQNKNEFINAVLDGTLNYYSAVHEHFEVQTNENCTVIIGQSYVLAAVFGGGKHYWHLQQKCNMVECDGVWKITQSIASTY
ncbi:MAG: nuclear transport factor 2 family protein [Eubacterium sp.]|nr:nuclear transport factor 2 family protein [Eubacterium sp.]